MLLLSFALALTVNGCASEALQEGSGITQDPPLAAQEAASESEMPSPEESGATTTGSLDAERSESAASPEDDLKAANDSGELDLPDGKGPKADEPDTADIPVSEPDSETADILDSNAAAPPLETLTPESEDSGIAASASATPTAEGADAETSEMNPALDSAISDQASESENLAPEMATADLTEATITEDPLLTAEAPKWSITETKTGSSRKRKAESSTAKQKQETKAITSSDTWPGNEFTELIPQPSFSVKIEGGGIDSHDFALVFQGASIADIKAYVEEIKKAGFSLDVATDEFQVMGLQFYDFEAENKDGYEIEVFSTNGFAGLSMEKP
jgi:hypothetical protein